MNMPINTWLKFRKAIWLYWGLTISLLAVSIIALIMPQKIYPEPEYIKSFLANDVINLLIGIPVLIIPLILAGRGHILGLLLLPGAILYVFYNNLVYLFSMPFNLNYLFYIIILMLSIWILIRWWRSLELDSLQRILEGNKRSRYSAIILFLLGLGFLIRALNLVFNPDPLHTTELALNIADTILALVWMFCGFTLWRKSSFGLTLEAGLLYQGSMLFIGLIVLLLIQPLLSGSDMSIIDVVVVFIMGFPIFFPLGLLIIKLIKQKESPHEITG